MLYISHGSTDLNQNFTLCMRVFMQHFLQIQENYMQVACVCV